MKKLVSIALAVFLGLILAAGVFVQLGGHVHASSNTTDKVTRHLTITPGEVTQPADFTVTFSGVHFPPSDTLDVQTDASFGSVHACEVDGITALGAVHTNASGGFSVSVHFSGCKTNAIVVSANDDGHLYQTILDVD